MSEGYCIAWLSRHPGWRWSPGSLLLLTFEDEDGWLAMIGKMLCLSQRLNIGRELEVVRAMDLTLELSVSSGRRSLIRCPEDSRSGFEFGPEFG